MLSQTVDSRSVARDWGFIVAGAALTAVCARVEVPMDPVPLTLQTLAVTVCGLRLGMKRGAMSQIVYLLAGAAGLPIFAEGKTGIPVLFGQTGGYLWAFVLAAGMLGWMAERGWDKKIGSLVVGLLLAHAVMLLCGALWLSLFVGITAAFVHGVLPFLAGSAIKTVLATASVPSTWKTEER